MATVVEDIIQAIKRLGGRASLDEIYAEYQRVRTVPLPVTWMANVRGVIGNHSSDSNRFLGKNNYFKKMDRGVWALRERSETASRPQEKKEHKQTSNAKVAITESFESISNTFKTIKEYRDYSNPNSPSWQDYIREIFHLLGFNTEQKDARLFVLKDLGGNSTLAIVAYARPGEDFDCIAPDLSWESYLQFAASFYNINWGILINGLQIRITNFDGKNQAPFYWPNLDEIIREEKLDSFFEIYKIFSMIKNPRNINKSIPSVGPKSTAARPTKTRRARNSDSMPKGLLNVLDVCDEMSVNGENFNKACIKVAKNKKLKSFHTVGDACLRRIGMNTNGFRSLYTDKHQLIAHLISYYPSYADEITKALS
jgi:hypothetical protein